jgi:hypothetical protein
MPVVHVHGSDAWCKRYWCAWFAGIRRVAVMRGGHLAILRTGSVQRRRAKWPQVTLCLFRAPSSKRPWHRRVRMDADVDVRCNAEYGEVMPDR